MITFEQANKLVRYCRDTGNLYWLVNRPLRPAGSVAGCPNGRGYMVLKLQGKSYQAHRIAWLLVTGVHPSCGIDHINGNKLDNRMCNLRLATQEQNSQNRVSKRNSRTGLLGVTWNNTAGKWTATIISRGVRHHLGVFDTPVAAHEAYKQAKLQLHTFSPVVRSA